MNVVIRRSLLVVSVVVLTACTSGLSPTTPSSSSTPKPSPTTKTSPEFRDPNQDVTVGKWTQDPVLGFVAAHVTIINHSPDRSSYTITLDLESRNYSVQYDTSDVFVEELDAGQAVLKTVTFYSVPSPLPKSTVIVVDAVDRIPS